VWLHLPHPLRASPDLCTRHNTLLEFGMRVSSFLTDHVFIHEVFLMSHVFINEFSSSPLIGPYNVCASYMCLRTRYNTLLGAWCESVIFFYVSYFIHKVLSSPSIFYDLYGLHTSYIHLCRIHDTLFGTLFGTWCESVIFSEVLCFFTKFF
jgi:hypothetical protein